MTELERYKLKVENQAKQIAALKKELDAAQKGTEQVSIALDGILTELALKFGEKTEDGVILTLPLIKIDGKGAYDVSAERAEDTYRVTVKKKKEGKKDACGQG